MIVVESKRKKIESLEKKYPGAVIIDVTSHATDQFYCSLRHPGLCGQFQPQGLLSQEEHALAEVADPYGGRTDRRS